MPDRGYEQYLETRPPSGNRGYEVFVDAPIPHDPEELSSAVGYYKEGTPLEEIRRLEAQRTQSSLPEQSNVQRFAKWTLRTLGKAAPYIAASEIGGPIGARLLPGLPVLGNVLGSALSQAGVAKAQGATFGETAWTIPLVLATEGGMTKFGKGSALKRGVPPDVASATLSKGTIGRTGEMIGRVTNAQEAAEASRVSGATGKALFGEKAPGRLSAEEKMAAFDEARIIPEGEAAGPLAEASPLLKFDRDRVMAAVKAGKQVPRDVLERFPEALHEAEAGVPTRLIRSKIRSHIIPDATTDEQIALNAKLNALSKRVSDRMTMGELDSFIREQTMPISGTYGKTEVPLPGRVRQDIVGFARTLRNKYLPAAMADFKSASQYISSTKTLRKMLVDAKGDVRPGAVNIWRQAMGNDIIKQRLENFEKVTGGQYDVVNRGMALARKSYWAKEDAQAASGILRMTSRGNMAVSIKTPGWVAKGLLLGSKPTGAITSSMMQEAYKEQRQQVGEQTPEDMFPGMTNIGQPK